MLAGMLKESVVTEVEQRNLASTVYRYYATRKVRQVG